MKEPNTKEKHPKGWIQSLKRPCPFCKGKAEFCHKLDAQGQKLDEEKYGYWLIHHPEAGVICPVRIETHCDNLEFAELLWRDDVVNYTESPSEAFQRISDTIDQNRKIISGQ